MGEIIRGRFHKKLTKSCIMCLAEEEDDDNKINIGALIVTLLTGITIDQVYEDLCSYHKDKIDETVRTMP